MHSIWATLQCCQCCSYVWGVQVLIHQHSPLDLCMHGSISVTSCSPCEWVLSNSCQEDMKT